MKLYDLLDNAKCYERVRQFRWPDGVTCPCKFDDLTLSVFSGHHQPLKVWISCLHFLHLMSLNISNHQIAQELDLNISPFKKAEDVAAQLVSTGGFTAVLRFYRDDPESKQCTVERFCFLGRIDDWVCINGSDSFKKLAEKYIRLLGTDEFYNPLYG